MAMKESLRTWVNKSQQSIGADDTNPRKQTMTKQCVSFMRHIIYAINHGNSLLLTRLLLLPHPHTPFHPHPCPPFHPHLFTHTHPFPTPTPTFSPTTTHTLSPTPTFSPTPTLSPAPAPTFSHTPAPTFSPTPTPTLSSTSTCLTHLPSAHKFKFSHHKLAHRQTQCLPIPDMLIT